VENTISQADIDALMRSLLPSGGEDPFHSKETGLRTYDFRRPTKFKKDLLRTLVMVHDNFARLLQNFLFANLHTRAQVQVRGTNQYLFAEFTELLPNPAVVATFKLDPLPGICLLEISHNIAFAIIDKVFGGNGSEVQPQRNLSDIELSIIRRMVSDMFAPLQEAWRNVLEIRPKLEGLETNPLFLQTSPPSEVHATVTLGVQIGEHMGHLMLAFPSAAMDPVLSRLSMHTWLGSDKAVAEADSRALQTTVQQAPVNVGVHLGQGRITVGEFMALKVGDVISLDTRADGELPVYIGNCLTFYGRPGVVGTRMSIQITRHAPGEPF